MQSGRKKRIMIACVTFETAKVTDPIMFYEINKAHIIHYVKEPANKSTKVYLSFYERVLEIIKEDSPRKVEVVEHNERVTDFSIMLKTVLKIIGEEQNAARQNGENCEIYVNISSGGADFAAAATIASMMVPGTIPFSVGTKEYTVDIEGIKENYFKDGKPVGLTMSTFDPRQLPSYTIQMPEEHLVRGLRLLNDRNKAKLSVTSGSMVSALKDKGIWFRNVTPEKSNRKTNQRQNEAVYYQRDFVDRWLKSKWVVKDDLNSRYILTDEGELTIKTFYTE